MEAIQIDKIKNEVANRYYSNKWNKDMETNWRTVIHEFLQGRISIDSFLELENEVISKVAKQVAERQREMCNKKAKIKIVAHYEKLPKDTKSLPFTSKLGSSWKFYIDQKSILNAPIPEII